MCSIPEIKSIVSFLDEVKTIGIVVTDTEGVIVYANKLVTEIYEYSMEEFLGQKPSLFKSGYYNNDFYKEMWDTITNKRVYSNILCNKSKSGKDVWEHLTIIPIIKNDIIENYLAIIVDATEQRKTKLTLENLLKTSPDFVLILNKDKSIYQILPETVEEEFPFFHQYLQKSLFEYPFITEEHVNNLNRIFKQIDENPTQTFTYVFKILTPRGNRIFQGIYTRYNTDKYMIILTDITDEEITAAELHTLLAALSDLVIVFDTKGAIVKVYNCKYPYCVGGTFIGKNIVDVWASINPIVGEKLAEGIKTLLKTKTPLLVSYSYLDDKNTRIYQEDRLALITEDLILCTSRDITTSRQAELMEGLNNSISTLLETSSSLIKKLN